MTILKDSAELATFCKTLENVPYITVDTEFLRERTYWAKLCLIQLSGPDKNAVAIDVIESPDIDLTPLLKLFQNKNILKVFHAGRQDLEIFWQLFKTLPEPLFDTQIAAMVCGYGDQVGFNALVDQTVGVKIDKSQQFTDWSRRPLSNKQLSYALDDVIYLIDVFENLEKQLLERGRADWVLEETSNLLDPSLYENDPMESWQRIKVKSSRPQQLAILRELAAWREKKAQNKDIPKTHIMRDETLVDISFHPPKEHKDLGRIRGFPKGQENKPLGQQIFDIAQKGLNVEKKDWPRIEKKHGLSKEHQGAMEMLKMLLKIRASENDVAPRLIASKEDLEAIAQYAENAKTPTLKGWRKRIFGDDALKMLGGKVSLKLKDGVIVLSV